LRHLIPPWGRWSKTGRGSISCETDREATLTPLRSLSYRVFAEALISKCFKKDGKILLNSDNTNYTKIVSSNPYIIGQGEELFQTYLDVIPNNNGTNPQLSFLFFKKRRKIKVTNLLGMTIVLNLV
jgi:hypothetical protein